ncbi:MAG: ABC transporter ATP-binding protein, partial [Chloroflexota bacterium]
MATEIRLEKLRREFGPTIAVDDISVTFPSESVTCLLGPSGCGKTTLMRMIAGLQEPTSGEIFFGDRRVTDLTPNQRNIGMVFQYPVVYRGISLYQNVELPLKQEKNLSRAERRKRVDSVLESLDLTQYAKADAMSLPNAIKQKTAVARAVARQPQIILFDEPITNVDVTAKFQLKRALKTLVRQHAQTIVYVTHDQTEAMTLADEIALMDAGKIVQRGSPRDIYNNPSSRFGGWFLGNPGMNFIDHAVETSDGRHWLAAPLFRQPIEVSGLNGEQTVTVGIRPERIRLGTASATSVKGTVLRTSIVVGGQHLATVQIGDVLLKVKVPHSEPIEDGAVVDVDCDQNYIALFAQDGE